MIKGCSKIFFFAIIIIAALYYLFSHYEFDYFVKAEENIKQKVTEEFLSTLRTQLSDVKFETNDLNVDQLKEWIDENSQKIDPKIIKNMYEDFSKFISDKVLDAKEIDSLKYYLKNYEKSKKR